MDFTKLWNYMQKDLAADKFENQMRQSANRKALYDNKATLTKQAEAMKVIENDVEVMSDRYDALVLEVKRITESIDSIKAELDKELPEDIDEITAKIQALQKLTASLTSYESELKKLHSDANDKDKKQTEIKTIAGRAKIEYEKVKAVYDGEFKADTAKLKALREVAEAESKNVEKDQLKRYKEIKEHITPPMAELIDGRCSCCNMQQPLGKLREITAAETFIDCDNCGRILFVKQ